MSTGTLYGLGVGPGDPEWLTVQAARLLGKSRHVCVPRSRATADSLALEIARPHLRGDAIIHEITFPMTADAVELDASWRQAAAEVLAILDSGEDCCFLTLGDAMLYSTYIYLLRALRAIRADVPVVTVPGVTAYSAAAALTEFAIGTGKRPVTIVPACDDMTDLERALDSGGTVVLMKVGKRLSTVLDVLERRGLVDSAVLVSRAGRPEQRIEKDMRQLRGAPEEAGYLSIVLIHAVAARERGEGVPPLRPAGVSPAVDDPHVQKRPGHCLPHWIKEGASYAVTFRLADAMPSHILEGWRREREDILARAKQSNRELTKIEQRELEKVYSDRVEAFMDSGQGQCYLKRPEIAELVIGALKHFDRSRYDLVAWCLMPNHVHVILRPAEGQELSGIIHSWKSYTAKQANNVLNRTGTFWQDEYYDHLIRDEEDFQHALNYLLGNPAKAGLERWPYVGVQNRGQDAPGTQGRDALATEERP